MPKENYISQENKAVGTNRIRTMEIFDLTNDKSEVFVTLKSKQQISQPRDQSSAKRLKKRASISPWQKDQLK